MNGLLHPELDSSEFVEVDPTGRYGRYNEILGKGASKTVYRAFDEYEGIEVAWNQVKLYDFLQSPEDLERLYCEIHLLKTLKHKNIMKFYTSWVDTANRNINFVTEMFTSGTLRQYRLKHRRVNIRAVKHWCRQILRGLLYLHSHDPPVIHRDLKCDNIFVNGNQGEVKIGDLGLAAILRRSHAAHCVGTPEFMAPEVYEEAYNELVDIYSFGMCVLEMVTFEYPYSECTHPAQIYKKVISGKKPDALYKVKDPEVRQFVEKCLATVSLRLSARELLNDPFLKMDGCDSDFRQLNYGGDDGTGPLIRQPYLEFNGSGNSYCNGFSNDYSYDTINSYNSYSNGYGGDAHNDWEFHPVEIEPSGIEFFEHHDDESSANVDISIKGKRREDDSIFLRLRIADREGRIRNIYFRFDIETDTALSVATEMVAELDITDQDVTRIADMIDGEIASLVPEWRPGPGIEETPGFANPTICHNCASTRTSNGSIVEFLSNPCCRHGCGAMHGRFEEITCQPDESDHEFTGVSNALSQLECSHYQEIWVQHESRELTPVGSGRSHSDEEYEKSEQSVTEHDEKETKGNEIQSSPSQQVQDLTGSGSGSSHRLTSLYNEWAEKHENEIQQELRWLKAKYEIELRKHRDQQLGIDSKSSKSGAFSSPVLNFLQGKKDGSLLKPISQSKHFSPELHTLINKGCPYSDTQRSRNCEVTNQSPRTKDMVTTKSLCNGSMFPHSLHRTLSLPVDAVDV